MRLPHSFDVEIQGSNSDPYLRAVPGWFPGLRAGCSVRFMCIPTPLIILPFPKLLLSLVTTVKFLQIQEKLIQIEKNAVFLARLATRIIQYQCQLKTGHKTTLNLLEPSKCETMLVGKMHFSKDMTEFMTMTL